MKAVGSALILDLMHRARFILEETKRQLTKVYEEREARNIALMLLEDLFHLDKVAVLSDERIEIDEHLLQQSIDRLLKNEPVQYVTGVADFFGRKFNIRQGALIPRPETEELVELIIDQNKVNNPKILDIGTGSGCIAITLALEIQTMVYATEVSDLAFEIAKQNATQLRAHLEIIKHDILTQSLPFSDLDILVSNPPYIPEKEKAEMSKNVLEYEPGMALFVPDNDPLLFYRRIAEEGVKALKPGGKLYFEIHENYGQEIRSLLEQMEYADVSIHQDMQGKDRMISAINSTSK